VFGYFDETDPLSSLIYYAEHQQPQSRNHETPLPIIPFDTVTDAFTLLHSVSQNIRLPSYAFIRGIARVYFRVLEAAVLIKSEEISINGKKKETGHREEVKEITRGMFSHQRNPYS